MSIHSGITYGLLAAILFGASIPLAKILLGQTEPLVLAALLYLGSGAGLSAWLILRRLNRKPHDSSQRWSRPDLPWLAGAIITGGMIGPVLLMTGLRITPAPTASLLLNLETVLTAVLAWFVFREHFDRRILLGMGLIVAASLLLSWEQGSATGHASRPPGGALFIVAACLCWAIDNNLTRKVSANDAVMIAAIKGMAAGIVNLALALWLDLPFPSPEAAATAAVIGFCGYGLSLVFFVLALRHLGAARTGAYFSIAPFAGAAIALALPGDVPGMLFWAAAIMMAAGIWLHLSETHVHMHTHSRMVHTHAHRHDEHHRHTHEFPWDGKEPHVHSHLHEPLTHEHPHFPDIHHRHEH